MFKFLKNGVAKDAPKPSAAPQSVPQHSIQQHTDIKRELIKVVLKDTLRRLGIPFDWLACEIIVIARGPDDEELHIQLVLMKWQETFLRYAPALQQQLLRGLDRFDPAVDHSKYIISWRFSPECGCPFSVMPPARFWSHSDAPLATAEEAPAILDRRQTKRPPKAPAKAKTPVGVSPQPSTHPAPPPGEREYQSTQLSPLR